MKKMYVEQAKEYIETHYMDTITLDDIAGEVGYSKYHLNHMFAEQTGKTLYQYLKRLRLEKAAGLLKDTKQPIVEIALSVGFASQQSFTMAFKQEFDCTPQRYRNAYYFYRAPQPRAIFSRESISSITMQLMLGGMSA